VAEVAFIKAVRERIFDVDGDEKTLIINCPHPSMQMRHFADSITCDSAGMDGTLILSLSLRRANKSASMFAKIELTFAILKQSQ
jgi:hypothetical protein